RGKLFQQGDEFVQADRSRQPPAAQQTSRQGPEKGAAPPGVVAQIQERNVVSDDAGIPTEIQREQAFDYEQRGGPKQEPGQSPQQPGLQWNPTAGPAQFSSGVCRNERQFFLPDAEARKDR